MTTSVKSSTFRGMVGKVRELTRSADFAFNRALVSFAISTVFLVITAVSGDFRYQGMVPGFAVLIVLYLVKTPVTFFTAYKALNSGRQWLIFSDWFVSAGLRFVTAGLILSLQAPVLGHGLRDALWLAVVAYQCVVAVLSLALGSWHADEFLRPIIALRRKAMSEELLLADLADSLNVNK